MSIILKETKDKIELKVSFIWAWLIAGCAKESDLLDWFMIELMGHYPEFKDWYKANCKPPKLQLVMK